MLTRDTASESERQTLAMQLLAIVESAAKLGVIVQVRPTPTGPKWSAVVPLSRIAEEEAINAALDRAVKGEEANGVPNTGPEEQTGAVTS